MAPDTLTIGSERFGGELMVAIGTEDGNSQGEGELDADFLRDYIQSDPGIVALVEACQYVADPVDQDFRTANDKAIAALKTFETGHD